MQKLTSFLLLFSFGLLLSNCASGYQSINPKIISYASKNNSNEIILEYKYDLLQKKYKKKERKNDMRLIAVKLTNLSDRDLVCGKDLKFMYENGKPITPLETKAIFNETKQISGLYLLYLLLTPLQFTVSTNANGVQDNNSFPIGFFVGPGLAAGNMITANSSNRRYKKDLTDHNLLGKTIPKGETVYGLIGINSSNYDAITFKVE